MLYTVFIMNKRKSILYPYSTFHAIKSGGFVHICFTKHPAFLESFLIFTCNYSEIKIIFAIYCRGTMDKTLIINHKLEIRGLLAKSSVLSFYSCPQYDVVSLKISNSGCYIEFAIISNVIWNQKNGFNRFEFYEKKIKIFRSAFNWVNKEHVFRILRFFQS